MREELNHHTTFNIEHSTMETLRLLAEMKNISVSDAIKMLLKLVSEEMEYTETPKRLIEYQRLPSGGEWKTFHIRLTYEEVEHFEDMRNFFKKSVSFLIACAVEQYGNLLLNVLPQQTDKGWDKNLFPHYSSGRKVVSGEEIFIISWGKPTKFLETISLL